MSRTAIETDPTDERSRSVDALLDILDQSPSGHAFVRQTLRALMDSWGLEAAALVTLDSSGERQVLTADGQPPRGRLRELVDAFHGQGLVTDPQIPQDAPRAWAVRHVAEIALQLDREGWAPELDTPSGLLNRAGFRRRVLLARARHEHGDHPFALVVLDVDDVELLDTDVADSVIHRTGAALNDTVRRIDDAARVDNHRFAVVLEGADRADARSFLSRFRDRLGSDPILSTVSYRIGVASCPEDTLDTTHVLRSATLRLAEGEVEMRALPGRRLDLVATVELGTLTHHDQRSIDLPGGPISDVEAAPEEAPAEERPTIRQLRQARGLDRNGQPTEGQAASPARPDALPHDVVERTPPPYVPEPDVASPEPVEDARSRFPDPDEAVSTAVATADKRELAARPEQLDEVVRRPPPAPAPRPVPAAGRGFPWRRRS